MARPLARRLARPVGRSAARPPGMSPLSMSFGAATMCSGSSSLRSRLVRLGLGCQGGLDPQRYIEHTRGRAHRSSARRSTAQPSAQCIKIDTFSIAFARRPI
eukprot:136971-Pyramimonas_sp.AAC.1